MTITAQDFSTTELVEALTARGYFVRTLSHLDALNEAIAAERERAAAELAVLTERMEAEIAEACAAVRARTIEECMAIVGAEIGVHESKLLLYPEEDSRWVDCNGRANEAVEIYNAIRALATPAPTAEPAPVDPAAGALR
jgi:hypothetical protein